MLALTLLGIGAEALEQDRQYPRSSGVCIVGPTLKKTQVLRAFDLRTKGKGAELQMPASGLKHTQIIELRRNLR
jgi:hypothetical protein